MWVPAAPATNVVANIRIAIVTVAAAAFATANNTTIGVSVVATTLARTATRFVGPMGRQRACALVCS